MELPSRCCRDKGRTRALTPRHVWSLRYPRSYLSKVGEVAAPGYVPSVEDVLKTRVRTSGILEESYEIDGVSMGV